MKYMMILACLALFLNGCGYGSTGGNTPAPRYASCSLARIDGVNADYEAQMEYMKSYLYDTLYAKTPMPVTDADRMVLADVDAEFSILNREKSLAYNSARTSCSQLLACETSISPLGNIPAGCSSLRGARLGEIEDFYDFRNTLKSKAEMFALYTPFEPVTSYPWAEEEKRKHGKKYKPTVHREQDCPTIADVLTVCADKDK